MFRAALWTVRQPRYAALSIAMLLVAAFCVAAGVFELHRYQDKRHDNRTIRANAQAAPVPLRPSLVALTGSGDAPSSLDVRYRAVTVTGRYLPSGQTYLDGQQHKDEDGFAVLTPLRTADGVVLVARGFVAASADGHRPGKVAPAPTGQVTVTGRLQTASGSGHQPTSRGEISTVDPAGQAARLGAPVYQAYVTLRPGQPGARGLTALPGPSLSNPTGGASEWQLASYFVQWWVFAVLALLAPFLICRAEVRDARRQFLGVEDVTEFDLMLDDALAQDAPALEGGRGPVPALDGVPGEDQPADGSGTVAVRAGGTLAERAGVSPEQYARAVRLADRYGRSLGPEIPGRSPLVRRVRGRGAVRSPVLDSSAHPHRSEGDDYHGIYNDYLWQLALQDGELPQSPDPEAQHPQDEPQEQAQPWVVDVDPAGSDGPGGDDGPQDESR